MRPENSRCSSGVRTWHGGNAPQVAWRREAQLAVRQVAAELGEDRYAGQGPSDVILLPPTTQVEQHPTMIGPAPGPVRGRLLTGRLAGQAVRSYTVMPPTVVAV